MKLRSEAKETLQEVRATSEKIGESAEWVTMALAAVTVVALVALAYSVAALREVRA